MTTPTVEFGKIEALISDLETIDRADSVLASLAWSFAMSIGQTMVRLTRVYDEDDPTYARLTHDQKEETTRRLEGRIDDYKALLAWAARGANPDFAPTGQDVVERITELGATQTVEESTIEEIAAEMGATVADVKRAQARNAERMKIEATLQAEAAKAQVDVVRAAIDNTIGMYLSPMEVINIYDGIRIVDRIAQKAADYAENALAQALRQSRARRRAGLNAERRLLVAIEEKADDLLDRFERDAQAARDAAEAEAA